MKGLDMARTVRINHVGWVMTRDFRFFLSLPVIQRRKELLDEFELRVNLPEFCLSFPSTSCQSFGSISSASWFRASYSEAWLRSCRWSGNLQPPASPGCWPRTCRTDDLLSGPSVRTVTHKYRIISVHTGRGFPSCSGSLSSCCQAGNRQRTRWWRSGLLRNSLMRDGGKSDWFRCFRC